MTSDTLIIIMAVIAATSSVVTMVGIIFPRIFFPSHVSHRRWKILGLWFGFVSLLVGYEQLTTMLMHNVPPLFVYLHLLLTILAVATVIPKVNPFKNKFNGEKKWFPLIGVIAVDALFLSIGYVCVKLGSTPMEGSANEKWVSKQISLLQNDSKELQRIEAIDITDTASVVYLRGLIEHVDSLGKPHLHSPYDSLFYYTDARISGISHQNQKRSKQIKQELRYKFKLNYLYQLRKKYSGETIYLLNDGDIIVLKGENWTTSYDQSDFLRSHASDLKYLGFKNVQFRWGEDSTHFDDVELSSYTTTY